MDWIFKMQMHHPLFQMLDCLHSDPQFVNIQLLKDGFFPLDPTQNPMEKWRVFSLSPQNMGYNITPYFDPL